MVSAQEEQRKKGGEGKGGGGAISIGHKEGQQEGEMEQHGTEWNKDER